MQLLLPRPICLCHSHRSLIPCRFLRYVDGRKGVGNSLLDFGRTGLVYSWYAWLLWLLELQEVLSATPPDADQTASFGIVHHRLQQA